MPVPAPSTAVSTPACRVRGLAAVPAARMAAATAPMTAVMPSRGTTHERQCQPDRGSDHDDKSAHASHLNISSVASPNPTVRHRQA
jgi:hypothetical protein